jgi:hypothetical protein
MLKMEHLDNEGVSQCSTLFRKKMERWNACVPVHF